MSASVETQRLITVSLGKIAQSRNQRGGINLHKNLLVATVLHKARTVYMLEAYGYQQTLQKQKLQQEQFKCASSNVEVPDSSLGNSNKGGSCLFPSDPNPGQVNATLSTADQTVPEIPAPCESTSASGPEPMWVQETDHEPNHDKENSPPFIKDSQPVYENITSQDDHLTAATQLSLDAQSTLTADIQASNVLKRRRNNCSVPQDIESPVNKKPRNNLHVTLPHSETNLSELPTDVSESRSESPQISNLVNIFNSGFSGLCAVSGDSAQNSSSGYQSDLDISNSQFTPVNKVRSEFTASSYSRVLPDSSLLCSSQICRLDSLPSAIVLSA